MERDSGHYSCEGLPSGGVLVSEIRNKVSEGAVCQHFGPRSTKSGWRYNAVTTLAEQTSILSLYRLV